MSKQITGMICATVVFFCGLLSMSSAAAPPTQPKYRTLLRAGQRNRAFLQGLERVYVYINHYRGEKEQAEQLRTEIELRLRQAGIQVWSKRTTAPYVHLMVGRNQAEVQEFGSFERRGKIHEFAVTTWESRNFNWKLRYTADWPSVRRNVMIAVDEFINDYLAANMPRQE